MTVQAIRQQTASDATTQTAPAGSGTGGLSGAAFLALVRQSSQRYSGQTAIASAVSGLTGQLAAADEARDEAAASRAQSQNATTASTATVASDRGATALATSAARTRRDDSTARASRNDDDAKATDDTDASGRTTAPSGDDDAPAPVARSDDDDDKDEAAPEPALPLALVTPEPTTAAVTSAGSDATGEPAAPTVPTTAAAPAAPAPAQTQAAQTQAAQAQAQTQQAQTQLDAQSQATAQAQTAAQAATTADAADTRQAQANDLAARLAGTGAGVAVGVQGDSAPPASATTPTPPAAGPVAAVDPTAAQGQGGQNAGATGDQTANGGTAATLAQASAAASTDGEAAAAETGDSFTALLAAQSEATGVADKTAPANPVTGLSAVAPLATTGRTQTTAPAGATATTPRPLPTQVLEQISVQIDKAVKDGLDTVKIQLKPIELGKIEIKLEMGSDGKVTATVTADKPETLAMLQGDQRGLEKALQDAGLKPDSSATSFNLRGDGQSAQQQAANRDASAGQGQSQSQPRGRESGGYGGDPALAAALSALSTPASADGGVDISV